MHRLYIELLFFDGWLADSATYFDSWLADCTQCKERSLSRHGRQVARCLVYTYNI